MIVIYGIIVILLVNYTSANFDNETWIDYETLINDGYNMSIEQPHFRNAIYVDDLKYDSEFQPNMTSNDYDRIVGGTGASIENYRYQVSIQEKGFGHFCGGSIITPKWVLTAAHCFYGSNTPTSQYRIRAGSSFHARGGVFANPQKIYIAKKFNPSTNDYDIGLIKLENGYSKQMSQYPIRRIYIRRKLPPRKSQLVVTGWGTIRSGGPGLPPQLRRATVPLMDYNYCNTQTNNVGLLTRRMFCAGVTQGGRDSCQGDSGGPITYGKKLVGIVSWGLGCAARNSPGVYTNVPVFLPYIKALLKSG